MLSRYLKDPGDKIVGDQWSARTSQPAADVQTAGASPVAVGVSLILYQPCPIQPGLFSVYSTGLALGPCVSENQFARATGTKAHTVV